MTGEVARYVVGEERRLADILSDADVVPIIRGVLRVGVTEALIADAAGTTLWREGSAAAGGIAEELPLYLEGEEVGRLLVRGEGGSLRDVALLMADLLNTLVVNNLKRMLTTEAHSAVVDQSYGELLDTNRRLARSEANYRELAEHLEQKVEERSRELKQAYLRLLEQEKMASVGQLAAGVAHEINNPLGFITSNLYTLQKYAARFMTMLDFYRTTFDKGYDCKVIALQAAAKWREMKLDHVCSDVEDLIVQSIDGAERVRRIVADLKGFSHVDETSGGEVEINAEIDRALRVMEHYIPRDAELVRNYREIPAIAGNPALLGQAFLNIIQNAVQAMPSGLRLVIDTSCGGAAIRVSFADNGPGIPAEVRNRVFEPFYTTREVGKGTGLGLAVVYDVVTGYGGSIEVACPPDGGTIVAITLPLRRE
ncbi:MAG TPA: ATP-binding protein [Geobacteraceae bacterium]